MSIDPSHIDLAAICVQERIKSLNNLSKEGSIYEVSERLRLWIKSTLTMLRKHFVDAEVIRIERIEVLDTDDEVEKIRDLEEQFNIRLKSLLEQTKTHPEILLLALASPAKPTAGSYFSLMHRSIITHSQRRFESGEYADAVEAALKEVNCRVKMHVQNQGKGELDGVALMNFAFSSTKPVITLADLSNKSGQSEQLGYMQIFAGAMVGIRNPKAHSNLSISPERCIHLLMLASLLMYKLDDSNVVQSE